MPSELLRRAAPTRARREEGTVASINQNKLPGERRAELGFQEHTASQG